MIKLSHCMYLVNYGIKTVVFRKKDPIIGCIILTDRCNLSCKHCSVKNITGVIYSYSSILSEMRSLYKRGIRILMFYGGETFLWNNSGKTVRDLVIKAKEIGFFIVNIVTNGTFPMNVPEADTILVSLDGGREKHNIIRGKTYDRILKNIRECNSKNICLYMAVNRINRSDIFSVGKLAKNEPNIKAVSFNFHTPYPDTKELALTKAEKKKCCGMILYMMKKGVPVFNLRTAFPYMINNTFKKPAYQSIVAENGKEWVCGRCIDIDGLCDKCGFFYVCEYSLAFGGNIPVMLDMLFTYLKYM